MTDKITISAFQLFEMFPDEDIAKVAVEALREIAEHDGSWADAKTALAKIDASGWIPS